MPYCWAKELVKGPMVQLNKTLIFFTSGHTIMKANCACGHVMSPISPVSQCYARSSDHLFCGSTISLSYAPLRYENFFKFIKIVFAGELIMDEAKV